MRHLFAVILAALPCFAFAQAGPASFNISGALFQPTGTAVTQSNVNFKIEIWNAAATCLLYSEEHPAQDLTNTKGGFALMVGSGSNRSNLLQSSATLTAQIFENTGVAVGPWAGCPAPVTMSAGEERLIRVYYDLGGGYVAMTPDVPLGSSAYAMVAETLQGKTPANFVQVNDDGATVSLSQTNLENAFSFANYPKLMALINGTSAQYLSGTPTAPMNLNNQRISNLADPTAAQDAATKNYSDTYVAGKQIDLQNVGVGTGGGKVLMWDQAQNKWVAQTPTAVGTAGGDLTGTYPNPAIAVDAVTSAKIKDGDVSTADLANQSITPVKLVAGAASVNRLMLSDGITGTTFAEKTCANDEVLKYTIATGWTCTSVSSLAPVTQVEGRTGNVDIDVADLQSAGTAATRNVGTGVGDVITVQTGGKLPALDGSALTNLGAALGTGYFVDGGNTRGADLSIGANDNFALNLKTNGAPRLSILNDGKLGVGTTSPSTKFSVAGAAADNAYFFYDNATVPDGADGQSIYLYRRGITYGDTYLRLYNSDPNGQVVSASNNLYLQTSSVLGNVYIANNNSNKVLFSGGGDVQLGATWNGAGTNKKLIHYGYITEATANKYVAWQVNDASNNFELSREDANIGAFDVKMPLLVSSGAARLSPAALPGSPAAGDLAVDSADANKLKWYNGSGWQTVGTSSATGDLNNGGNNGAVVIGSNDNTLSLEANNATAMTILSNGNTGIGVTNPGSKLEVAGQLSANQITLRNSYLGVQGLWSMGANQSHFSASNTGSYFGGNSSNAEAYMASGSFFNGTDWYAVQSTAVTTTTDNVNGFRIFGDTGLPGNATYTPTELLRVTATGDLGIGVTAPARKLDVNGPIRVRAAALPGSPGAGDIAIDSSDANKLKWHNGSGWQTVGTSSATGDLNNGGNNGAIVVGSNDNTLSLEANNATAVTILGNGNVGLGITSPSANLEVNGTTVVHGAINAFNNSGLALASGMSNNTVGGVGVKVSGSTFSAASGIQYPMQIIPTYNQSGTAGSTDLLINRNETALGTGSHYFIDAQVAGTTKFNVSNNGSAYFGGGVTANGNINATSSGYTIAVGNGSSAGGWSAVALGDAATANGSGAIALGFATNTGGTRSATLGTNSITSANHAVSIGRGVTTGNGVVASGLGDYSISIGAGNPGGQRYVTGTGSVGVFLGGAAGGTTISTNDVMSVMGGNVGIGVTAPARLLDVAGPIRVGAAALPASPAAGDIAVDSGDANKLKWYNGSGWQTVGTSSATGDFMKDGSVAMTGSFKAADGTQAAPGISFANDTDTGFYRANNDEVRLSLGNSWKVNFATNQTQFLQPISATRVQSINSNASAVYSATSAASPYPAQANVGPSFWLENSSPTDGAGAYYIMQARNAGSTYQTAYMGAVSNGAGTTPTIAIGQQTGANAYSERMRIDQNGNVGIGTTSPDQLLHLSGADAVTYMTDTSSSVTGSFGQVNNWTVINNNRNPITGAILDSGRTSAVMTLFTGNADSYINFYTADTNNTTPTERMRIDKLGNVGIGITAPARLLHVNGPVRVEPAALPGSPAAGDVVIDSGDANKLKWYNGSGWQVVGTSTATGDLNNGGNNGAVVVGSNDSTLSLEANNATAMTVLANGNVGIGTTNPGSKLEVTGGIVANASSMTGLTAYSNTGTAAFLQSSNAGNTAPTFVIRRSGASSANLMEIQNDVNVPMVMVSSAGNVGIGTTSPSATVAVSKTDTTTTTGFNNIYKPAFTGNWSGGNPIAAFNQVTYDQNYDMNVFSFGAVNRIQTTAGTTGTMNLVLGSINDVYNTGNKNITGAIGGQMTVRNQGTGTIADATAAPATIINSSTGTITSATGLYSKISNTGAGSIGTSYGLYVDTIAGTNKWSIYTADATAPNYFAGSVGVGTTAPSAKLSVSLNSTVRTPNANTNVHITGADGASNALTTDAYGNNFYDSPFFSQRKARGTAASPTVVQNYDILGESQTFGWDGTDFSLATEIENTATETWSGSARGSRIRFNTTKTGTTTKVISASMTGDGLGVLKDNPGRPLDVNGSMRLAAGALPASPGAGDIAIDSGDANKLKFHNGTSWVTVGSGTGNGDFMKDGSVAMTGNLRSGGNWISNDGGNEGLWVGTDGKIGAGTSAPASQFHVEGATTLNGDITIGNDGANNGASRTLTFTGLGATGNPQQAYMVLDAYGGAGGEALDFHIAGQQMRVGPGFFQADKFSLAAAAAPEILWYNTNAGLKLGNTYTQTSGLLLDVHNGGNTKLAIDYTGKVGVGTTAPAQALHVFSSTSSPMVLAESTWSGGTGMAMFQSKNSNGKSSSFWTGGPTWHADDMILSGIGTHIFADCNAAGSDTATCGKISFYTNSYGNWVDVPKVMIDPSGKMGIGTTAPAQLLHVNGVMRLAPASLPGSPGAGDLAIDSGDANKLKFHNGTAWVTVGAGTGNGDFMKDGSVSMTGNYRSGGNWISNDGGNEGIFVDTAGNVGIGTSTPGYNGMANTLTVQSPTSRSMVELVSGLSDAQQVIGQVGGFATANTGGNGTQVAAIQFATSGTTANDRGGRISFNTKANGSSAINFAMTINEAGNVGIGTSNPGRSLDVNGTMRLQPAALPGSPAAGDVAIDSGDANKLKFHNGTSWVSIGAGGGSGDFMKDGSVAMTGNLKLNGNWLSNDGGSEGIFVDTSGNVGLGTTSPGSMLHLAGPSGVNAVTFNTPGTSKGRLGTLPSVQDWLGYFLNASFNGTGWDLDDTSKTGWFFKLDSRASSDEFAVYKIPSGANPHTNEYPRMMVSANDKAAIGALAVGYTPTSALDVKSAGNTSGSAIFNAINSSGTSAMYVRSDGMVGIGTTNPTKTLEIFATSGSSQPFSIRTNDYVLGSTGTTLNAVFGAASGNTVAALNTLTAGSSAPGTLVLQGAGGNVGVGTTSPQSILDVAGEVRMGSSGGGCSATNEGAMRYNSGSKAMQFCNGTSWTDVNAPVATAYASKLKIINNTTTPNTKLDITASEIWVSNGTSRVRFTNVNMTNDDTGTGAGKLDTGVRANNTWYYVWAISDGSVISSLVSTSSTAPTLPGGYTYKQLIGVARTAGAANYVKFVQYNEKWHYQNYLTVLSGGTATSWTSQTMASYVPPTATHANLVMDCAYGTAGGTCGISADGVDYHSWGYVTSTTVMSTVTTTMPIITPQTLYYYVNNTGLSNNIYITGFILPW